MMAVERVPTKRRLVNPQKTSAGSRGKARSRRNPGAVLTLGIINPEHTKRRKPVAKKKPKKNPSRAAKKNPVKIHQFHKKAANAPKRHKRRGKKNPQIVDMATSMVKDGAFALAGLVLTRQVPQLVLKDKNSGVKGYAANALAAIAAAMATAHFVGTRAGADVLIGGGLYVVNRVLTEQVSPVGKWVALSGLGNGDAAAASRMGAIQPNYSPVPVAYDENGRPIPLEYQKAFLDQRIAAALPPPASPSAGKLSGRLGLTRRRMAPGILIRPDRSPQLT